MSRLVLGFQYVHLFLHFGNPGIVKIQPMPNNDELVFRALKPIDDFKLLFLDGGKILLDRFRGT